MLGYEGAGWGSTEEETAMTRWQKEAEIDRQNLCKIMLEHYKAVGLQIDNIIQTPALLRCHRKPGP